MSSGTTQHLNGVWGSSGSDVFAVGNSGTIVHYDGNAWSEMDSGTTWVEFDGVWGSSGSDVFAVGSFGNIRHYDGGPEINLKQDTTNITDGGTQTVVAGTDTVFTIENIGNADLTLTTPLTIVGDAAFSIEDPPAATLITPGGKTTFTVRFSPASAGVKTATVSIINNDSDEDPYDLILTGTGIPADINLKQGATNISDGGSYNFGSKTVGTDTNTVFTIENTGTAVLTLSAPVISGADFTIEAEPASTVEAGKTTAFTMRFSPASTGAKTATFSIANNDSDENPYNLTITGDGASSHSGEIIITQVGQWGGAYQDVFIWSVEGLTACLKFYRATK
ncbi:choice-of-anchor D domain-containing protein [Desulfococcaceae bacterium HSG9]|nr:choice-of-anchor D domain-containing protein [Desulfococcaceae bacterium HSG9]